MFKEFAVDPATITGSYRDLVYVIEKFGMHQGRLISEFPGIWKKLVYEAAQKNHTGTKEITRITEYLKRIKSDRNIFWSKARKGDYSGEKWIELAIQAHAEEPFDYILSNDELGGATIISLEHFDDFHECLASNRQWNIKRDPSSIAAAVAFHAMSGKLIKIIDPYFSLDSSRFQRPFKEILSHLNNKPEIQIYSSVKHPINIHNPGFKSILILAKSLGITLKFFELPLAIMHNRFFLTERGGLSFLTGLDDNIQGNGTTHDDVTLLDQNLWNQHWNTYQPNLAISEWIPL